MKAFMPAAVRHPFAVHRSCLYRRTSPVVAGLARRSCRDVLLCSQHGKCTSLILHKVECVSIIFIVRMWKRRDTKAGRKRDLVRCECWFFSFAVTGKNSIGFSEKS